MSQQLAHFSAFWAIPKGATVKSVQIKQAPNERRGMWVLDQPDKCDPINNDIVIVFECGHDVAILTLERPLAGVSK